MKNRHYLLGKSCRVRPLNVEKSDEITNFLKRKIIKIALYGSNFIPLPQRFTERSQVILLLFSPGNDFLRGIICPLCLKIVFFLFGPWRVALFTRGCRQSKGEDLSIRSTGEQENRGSKRCAQLLFVWWRLKFSCSLE